MDKNKLVSVAFLNYNGLKILKKTLPSLINLKDGVKKEIIVVDNDSKDGSQEYVKLLSNKKLKNNLIKGVKLVANKENLGSPGINSVIGNFKGDYLFITDNDIELDKECLPNLIKTLDSDSSIGAVGPTYVNYFDRSIIESTGNLMSRSFYNGKLKIKGADNLSKLKFLGNLEVPFEGILLLRSDEIKSLKYIFDPDFFLYGEDVDLGLRIWLSGKKVVYVPKAVVYHMESVTTKKSFSSARITYFRERNLLATFFKILEWKNIICLSPYVVGMRFVGMIKDLLTLNFYNIFARLKAIFCVLIDFRKTLEKRKLIQKNRKIRDKELLKLFTESFIFKIKDY